MARAIFSWSIPFFLRSPSRIRPTTAKYVQGIVTGRSSLDEILVISNSLRRGGIAEETLAEFANGQPVIVVGKMDRLKPEQIISRARSRKGESWNLLTWNCEHFL